MKKTIAALLGMVAAMSAAQAQMISRPYVGIGTTTIKHDVKLDDRYTAFNLFDRKTVPKVFAGADLTPVFGVEVGHSRSSDNLSLRVYDMMSTADTSSRRTYAAGKATMALGERFALFGKLGVVHIKDTVSSPVFGLAYSESDNQMYGAVGGQFNMNQKLALIIEYERNGKKRDVGTKADSFTLAARYTF